MSCQVDGSIKNPDSKNELEQLKNDVDDLQEELQNLTFKNEELEAEIESLKQVIFCNKSKIIFAPKPFFDNVFCVFMRSPHPPTTHVLQTSASANYLVVCMT